MAKIDSIKWRQSCCGECGGAQYAEAQAANGEWLQLWKTADSIECIRYSADKVQIVVPKAVITEAELEAFF